MDSVNVPEAFIFMVTYCSLIEFLDSHSWPVSYRVRDKYEDPPIPFAGVTAFFTVRQPVPLPGFYEIGKNNPVSSDFRLLRASFQIGVLCTKCCFLFEMQSDAQHSEENSEPSSERAKKTASPT